MSLSINEEVNHKTRQNDYFLEEEILSSMIANGTIAGGGIYLSKTGGILLSAIVCV
jgi:hypothetical protein